MSRTPNVNSSGWLPLWGSNNQSNTVDNSTNKERNQVSSSNSSPKLTNNDMKKHDLELKKDRDSTKAIKSKASSSSLVNANNWLSWSSKSKVDHVEHHLENDDNNEQNLEENNNAEHQDNEIDDRENDDYLPDDNGDEIDEQISNDNRKKPSSWTFWNNGSHNASDNDSNNNNKDKKEKDKKISITNRILQSTPSLPNKEDISDSNEQKATKIDKANDKTNDKEEGTPPLSEQSGEDDAVLYKPHDNAKQFSKINTHKNENLKENVIVPDWRLCLPPQNSSSNSLAATLFGNSSTMNQGTTPTSKADMTNWRQFIHQLSTKLGFNTQSLTNVVEHESDKGSDNSTTENNERMEKEFNLIYEKAYRLYGRSLAKLPPAKRACLPNYDKFYTRLSNEEFTEHEHTSLGDNQIEDDSNDPNSISITNDPMGNLLINHKPRPAKNSKLNINSSDIVTHKSGPLRKIKKILIIGVHGFFPTKMIRPLIGAPKGTSLKFANEAEKALIRYCIENGLITEDESCNVSIQKIALEKEGKIFDRVEFFTEILTSWQTELNEADFIFVASHSQGCVVSIILLAKLIKMGILKDPIKKRIGILGMAGINNGPFYGVDKSFFMKAYSAIEHESMTELFELTKFTSQQSLVYKESTQIIINANVKICFIGSINDQLVPLYSAFASHIFHPNIYRACYIDHSSQTPLFVQKLVSLCCQLQNLGYFDNNVLKELSTVLAGPLTGGGHSKIYNDGKVYDLGIRFVLDTDDVVIPPTLSSTLSTKDFPYPFELNKINSKTNLVTSGVGTYGPIDHVDEVEEVVKVPITNHVYIKEYNVGKIGTNPFILPWCLRGLIFNIEKNWPNNNKLLTVDNGDDMGKNGYDEISELYELFENWKPDSKLLKDLKFRLNGIRASKL